MNSFEGSGPEGQTNQANQTEAPSQTPGDPALTGGQPQAPQYAPPQYAQPQAPQYAPQQPYAQPQYAQPQYPYPQPQYQQPTQPPQGWYGQPYQPQYPQATGQPGQPVGGPGLYPRMYSYPAAAPMESPIPLQPVATSRSHHFRWAIAGAVVLVVALVTAAGAFVLSGASGSKSLTASMAPKNTWEFMELRTDLPGDQHQKLADLMSHFPGFADRAQFDNALDEVFNRLTNSVSPDLAYTSAFKPWMEGEVSIAITAGTTKVPIPTIPPLAVPSDFVFPSDAWPSDIPMPSDLFGGQIYPTLPTSLSVPDEVVIVALKDRAAAQSWVSGELSRNHISASSQTYAGETLYTLGSGSPVGGMAGSYVITSQDLIVGTTGGVKAALDTRSNGSLADSAGYQEAMKSMSGDSLARMYMDPRAYLQSVLGELGSMSSMFGGSPLPSFGVPQLPSWMAASVRAESDRLVMEMSAPTTTTGGGNHSSVLAPSLPGSTVAVLEDHSVGAQVNKLLDELTTLAPSMGIKASQIGQVKSALAVIGGVDWLGDTAVAVTDDNGTIGGGVVVQTPDASTAKAKLTQLSSLLALGGTSIGLQTTTETYHGQTITLITIPQSGQSLGGGMTLTTQPVEIGLTTKDNVIVAGYTDAFAKEVIDTTSSNALSAQSDYNSVMNAVTASNAGSFYLNIPALEDQIGKMAVSSPNWTTNYKPYFDHLGGIGGAWIDGSTSTVRIVLTAQ